MRDKIKETSAKAISSSKIEVFMFLCSLVIINDTAQAVGEELNLADFEASMLPED